MWVMQNVIDPTLGMYFDVGHATLLKEYTKELHIRGQYLISNNVIQESGSSNSYTKYDIYCYYVI